MLNITMIGNVATYAIFFLPMATADLLGPYDYDRFALYSSQHVVAAIQEYYCTPDNTEFDFDLEKLKRYGYKPYERERFGIKTTFDMKIKVVGNGSNPRIATWHKKGRHVYLVDENAYITEKLKSELDDDLRKELGL